MATNQEKLDNIHAKVDRYLDTKSSHIAGHILDAPVKLEGSYAGKTSNLRARVAWTPHELDRLQVKVDLVLTNQTRIEQKLNEVLTLLRQEQA